MSILKSLWRSVRRRQINRRSRSSEKARNYQRRRYRHVHARMTPPDRAPLFLSQLMQSVPGLPASFPPAVLAGNVDADAETGLQKTIPYRPCAVVHGSSYHTSVTFRQEYGAGICSVENGLLKITAPLVSMQVKGVLIPTRDVPPSDAARWRIGILQVLLPGSKCKIYYGTTENPLKYYKEDYFSLTNSGVSDLPLIDRMTDDKHRQKQTTDRSDPAYSSNASSSALLEDVYQQQQVYCQLTMQDQPQTALFPVEKSAPSVRDSSQSTTKAPIYYLNKVKKECSFRTMLCVYKPGFSSEEIYPLYTVDWYFNVVANRDITKPDSFVYKTSPLSPSAFKSYSLARGNIPPFEFNCLRQQHLMNPDRKTEVTFESPNNVHKWLPVKLNDS